MLRRACLEQHEILRFVQNDSKRRVQNNRASAGNDRGGMRLLRFARNDRASAGNDKRGTGLLNKNLKGDRVI